MTREFDPRQTLIAAENGPVIEADDTGLVLRLSDRVIRDIARRIGLTAAADATPASSPLSPAERLDAALAALPPGGRLVANAVTLETEAALLSRRAALGGEMLRLAVSRAAPVAGMTGWRAAMPVTQWSWQKPAAEGAA